MVLVFVKEVCLGLEEVLGSVGWFNRCLSGSRCH